MISLGYFEKKNYYYFITYLSLSDFGLLRYACGLLLMLASKTFP